MSDYVLDSSAVLAVLQDEPGKDVVTAALPQAFISSVNLAEVVSKLSDRGMPPAVVRSALAALRLNVVPFTREHALLGGELRSRGLSLGDRACLALAMQLGLAAMTSDMAWVGATDVEVVLIR